MSAPEPRPAPNPDGDGGSGGEVRVRFWAAAKAAAGAAELAVAVPGETGLDTLVDLVLRRLPDRPGLGRVLGVCSVLVEDRPAGTAERACVVVRPGATVEFLPPFAGG